MNKVSLKSLKEFGKAHNSKKRKGFIVSRLPQSTQDKFSDFKGKLQIFARALLIPIAVLAIAGIFLGIGAVIEKYIPVEDNGRVAATTFKSIGSTIFALLPALFCLAIAHAFTNGSGIAVFSALVGYFALLTISGAQFITKTETINGSQESFDSWFGVIDFKSFSRSSVLTTVLGVKTINMSVFGGILVGPIVVWVYNRTKEIKLPKFLSFFSGERFVPIAVLLIMVPFSFFMALIWPWVGQAFVLFGQATGKIPNGGDGFLFGWIERLLVPTGLHNVFYSAMLYTPAGGSVDSAYTLSESVSIGAQEFAAGTPLYSIDAAPFAVNATATTALNALDSNATVPGIQLTQADYAVNSQLLTTLSGDRTIFQTLNGSNIQFSWISLLQNQGGENIGFHLGRFSAGKVPFMVFGIPAAGIAMILRAKKHRRSEAAGIILTACLTSFLTGITEPFEFTFLFLAPILFFGFHALMAGLSYLLAIVAGVNYGPTFGGVIDLVIFGIIPEATGQRTGWYWLLAIGAGYAVIYFFVFYYAIEKLNLMTPGRGDAIAKLITKKDYKKSKDGSKNSSPLDGKSSIILNALGGKENLTIVFSCISRLRVTLKDPNKVDYDLLQTTQPFGIVNKGKKAIQVVYGPDAPSIATIIKKKTGL